MTETELFRIKPLDSLHNSCRAVWVCKRCGNCALHCKHDDPANFHEDLDFPCSGPCQCIDCVPYVAGAGAEAEMFTIKPLEWEWFDDTLDGILKARGYRTGNGVFYAVVFQQETSYKDAPWSDWRWYSTSTLSTSCTSPEEGKQLAEAHWQEYIKQALAPVETS